MQCRLLSNTIDAGSCVEALENALTPPLTQPITCPARDLIGPDSRLQSISYQPAIRREQRCCVPDRRLRVPNVIDDQVIYGLFDKIGQRRIWSRLRGQLPHDRFADVDATLDQICRIGGFILLKPETAAIQLVPHRLQRSVENLSLLFHSHGTTGMA